MVKSGPAEGWLARRQKPPSTSRWPRSTPRAASTARRSACSSSTPARTPGRRRPQRRNSLRTTRRWPSSARSPPARRRLPFPPVSVLAFLQMPNAASAPNLTGNFQYAWRLTQDEGKQFTRLLNSLRKKGREDRQGGDPLRFRRARLGHVRHAILPGDLQGQRRRTTASPWPSSTRASTSRPRWRRSSSASPTWLHSRPRSTAQARRSRNCGGRASPAG